MPRKIFVDSSAWIAFAAEKEPRHVVVVKTVKRCLGGGDLLFTSNDVVDETITRLLYTVGFQKASLFLKYFLENLKKDTLRQLWTDEQVQMEAFGLVEKFAEHKLSLTDATTVVLMKRFNIDSLITLDSDFIKIGIPVLP